MELIVLGLSTWRVSHILIYEEGPGNIFGRIRKVFGVTKDRYPSRSMFVCMWCLTPWVGAVLLVIPIGISIPFALSAIALIVDALMVKWQ